MKRLDRLPDVANSPSTLSSLRVFRPAIERDGREQVHRVEVVGVVPIAGHWLAACRDLDDPPWHYEVLTPWSVAIGVTGTVRFDPEVSLLPARWSFCLDTTTVASGPKMNPPTQVLSRRAIPSRASPRQIAPASPRYENPSPWPDDGMESARDAGSDPPPSPRSDDPFPEVPGPDAWAARPT